MSTICDSVLLLLYYQTTVRCFVTEGSNNTVRHFCSSSLYPWSKRASCCPSWTNIVRHVLFFFSIFYKYWKTIQAARKLEVPPDDNPWCAQRGQETTVGFDQPVINSYHACKFHSFIITCFLKRCFILHLSNKLSLFFLKFTVYGIYTRDEKLSAKLKAKLHVKLFEICILVKEHSKRALTILDPIEEHFELSIFFCSVKYWFSLTIFSQQKNEEARLVDKSSFLRSRDFFFSCYLFILSQISLSYPCRQLVKICL